LPPEEYIEQAWLFGGLKTRLATNEPVQLLLAHLRQEILATTKLPMAIDYMLAELNHSGSMSVAMRKLDHYFAPFQAWIMSAAEDERGRMDMLTAMSILEHEARYRAEITVAAALFFFQLEVLCRHRLSYDEGLAAMAGDPFYDADTWLITVRNKIGFVDVADLIYVHSTFYREAGEGEAAGVRVVLFGEKEGRIALANRRRDPLYLFAALQRQLKYPPVPAPPRADPTVDLLPRLARRVEQMEMRLKLLEEEQRETGIDLSRFMQPPHAGEAGDG
jgi:hypothetical protein